VRPADLWASIPAREGHFVLESGYHTNLWLTLDAMFVEPARVAPLVAELARKLRPYDASCVCGPLLGGAFLAQSLSVAMGLDFLYAEPQPSPAGPGLFTAGYRLPIELARRVSGRRVVVVDDAISAGSSVRATRAALVEAGAAVPVMGTLLLLGEHAVQHFATVQVPIEAVVRRGFTLWEPSGCPLCRDGVALEQPLAIR
jgi:orotate phosphoribosyltransferase